MCAGAGACAPVPVPCWGPVRWRWRWRWRCCAAATQARAASERWCWPPAAAEQPQQRTRRSLPTHQGATALTPGAPGTPGRPGRLPSLSRQAARPRRPPPAARRLLQAQQRRVRAGHRGGPVQMHAGARLPACRRLAGRGCRRGCSPSCRARGRLPSAARAPVAVPAGAAALPTGCAPGCRPLQVALTENNTGGSTLFATKADLDFVPVCMKVRRAGAALLQPGAAEPGAGGREQPPEPASSLLARPGSAQPARRQRAWQPCCRCRRAALPGSRAPRRHQLLLPPLLLPPLQVKCEDKTGWVTYDAESTRFKMWVEREGGLSETTPQQFELDAGNHSRKWKSSFRLLGARRAGAGAGGRCWRRLQAGAAAGAAGPVGAGQQGRAGTPGAQGQCCRRGRWACWLAAARCAPKQRGAARQALRNRAGEAAAAPSQASRALPIPTRHHPPAHPAHPLPLPVPPLPARRRLPCLAEEHRRRDQRGVRRPLPLLLRAAQHRDGGGARSQGQAGRAAGRAAGLGCGPGVWHCLGCGPGALPGCGPETACAGWAALGWAAAALARAAGWAACTRAPLAR